MFFFGGVGALATVASCYGCVQKPGCFLWGRSTELRLVLELGIGWEENNCVSITNVEVIEKNRQQDKREDTV